MTNKKQNINKRINELRRDVRIYFEREVRQDIERGMDKTALYEKHKKGISTICGNEAHLKSFNQTEYDNAINCLTDLIEI